MELSSLFTVAVKYLANFADIVKIMLDSLPLRVDNIVKINNKRVHMISVCPQCKEEFEHPNGQKRKYCSRKCYGIAKRTNVTDRCASCKARAVWFTNHHKEELTILYECSCDVPHKEDHHYDYLKPDEIIRLCNKCHSIWHGRLRVLRSTTQNSTTRQLSVLAI